MANLINANQIRCNGFDIGLMKLDGVIVYQKKELEPEDFYVEYTIYSYYSNKNEPLSYYEYDDSNAVYLGLPSFYLSAFGYDKSPISALDCPIEITLNDGTITTDMSTLCSDIAKVKVWYPTTVAGFSVDTIGLVFNGYSIYNHAVQTISYIETSKFTTMHKMFYCCGNLTTLENANNWNTRNVTDMSYMFYGCSKLASLNLSNWNTRNVTNMNRMFCNCSKLASLGIANWKTSNVTDMGSMFYNCDQLTELDLSNFDTSNVTDMTSMFYDCAALAELDISNFNITDRCNYMFSNCISLHTLRLDNCNNTTISKIINSYGFPTGTINGATRKIYCKEENAAGLTPPTGWVFEFID